MKKFVLILCGTAMLASCDNTANVKSAEASFLNTDWNQQNLKGQVKSISETTTTIDSTGKEKTDSLTNISNFDEKGYMKSSLTKNGEGKVTAEQFVTHDSMGNMLEYVSNKNGKLVSRLVTELDKEGKYIGGKSFDSTDKQDGYYKDLKQNEYGMVYAGTQYDMNNKVKATWSQQYEKNHFLGGKSTDSTGKVTYEGTAKVNENGDMSEEAYTSVENGKSKSEKAIFKYDSFDEKGNWTQRTKLNEKGKPVQVLKRTISYHN